PKPTVEAESIRKQWAITQETSIEFLIHATDAQCGLKELRCIGIVNPRQAAPRALMQMAASYVAAEAVGGIVPVPIPGLVWCERLTLKAPAPEGDWPATWTWQAQLKVDGTGLKEDDVVAIYVQAENGAEVTVGNQALVLRFLSEKTA